MSRCFPYPPPGYAVIRNSEATLIESIKLQKEMEKSKADRKKEKKDKKERKRGTQAKEKLENDEFAHGRKRKLNAENTGKCEIEEVTLKSTQKIVTSRYSEVEKESFKAKADRKKEKKRREEKRREKEAKMKLIFTESAHGGKRNISDEESCKWETGTCIQNVGGDEAELERSGITEEHDTPVCSQNPCNSSDSTDGTNKRRKQVLPVNGISATGNILKIRLSSQNQVSTDKAIKERPCPASERTDSIRQHLPLDIKERPHSVSERTDLTGQQLFISDNKGCSTSGVAQGVILAAPEKTSSRVRKIRKIESRYRELIESWVPPPLNGEQADHEDDDWLFPSKKAPEDQIAFQRTCSDVVCASTASWQPEARHLAEVDVYALPFTVPF